MREEEKEKKCEMMKILRSLVRKKDQKIKMRSHLADEII